MYTINSKVKCRVEGIDKDGFNVEKEMYRMFFNEDESQRNNKEELKVTIKKLLNGFRRHSTIDINMYLGEDYKQTVSKRYCYRGFDGNEYEARILIDNCFPETEKYITKSQMINELVEVFMLMNYELDRK